MGVSILGEPDGVVSQVRDVVAGYAHDHPAAEVTVRRRGRYTVHVRILDPGFAGMEYFDRLDAVTPYLDTLPDEVYGEVTRLLLYTPEEAAGDSFPDGWDNREFERGTPVGA